MAVQPAYQPLMDRLLGFITQPEHGDELRAGRLEYVRHTGEVFEEDRSFDARIASFLDWFVFDRILAPYGETTVRAYPVKAGLDEARAATFRVLSRTVHGFFGELRWSRKGSASLIDLPTGVPIRGSLGGAAGAGLSRGDLFEGRLVPFGGALHFSPAFIFHPRVIKPLVVEELARQKREGTATPVQEIIFTLSRMAIRTEHYRYVRLEAIYDFTRPPPKVGPADLKFDRESVAKRLQKLMSKPPPVRPMPPETAPATGS